MQENKHKKIKKLFRQKAQDNRTRASFKKENLNLKNKK